MPRRVEVRDGEVTHPGDLTQGDWLIIARNARLLYAYTMGNASEDGEPPLHPEARDLRLAREPLFHGRRAARQRAEARREHLRLERA